MRGPTDGYGPPRRWRPVPIRVWLPILAVLAVGSGYVIYEVRSLEKDPREEAVKDAVAAADALQAEAIDSLWRSPSAEVARKRFADDEPAVFASRLTPAGDVTWDIVVYGHGSDPSSWASSDDVQVRACLRLTGRLKPDPVVTRKNITCSGDANANHRQGYDETVILPEG